MSGKKYGTILTIIIIIVVAIILCLIGKLVADLMDKKQIKENAEEAIAQFDKKIKEAEKNKTEDLNGLNPTKISKDLANFKYGGFDMMGYIEIPKIKVKYPVLDSVSKDAIKIAVAILQGPGLNQVGNTVIIGHNYRNGLFFSDIKKLTNNDDIYITDRTGTKIKYKVYHMFSTTPEDSSFYDRDTQGKREITLSTCSDSAKTRIIVYAREAEEENDNNNLNNITLDENTTQNIVVQNNQTNNTLNNTVQNTIIDNQTVPFKQTQLKK